MIGNRAIGLRTLSLAALVALVVVTYWSWLFFWQAELYDGSMSPPRYLIYNEFLLIGILFGSGPSQSSRGPYGDLVHSIHRAVRQAIAGYLGVLIVLVAIDDKSISRWFLASYFPVLLLTLVFANYAISRWLAIWLFCGDREERVALLGSPERALQMQYWLERKSNLGLKTVGLVCDSAAPGNLVLAPFPILGTFDAIGEILKRASINQLIVLDLSLGAPHLRQLRQLCESASVRLLAIEDFSGYFTHSTTTFEDDGIRFIGLRDEPLESPINRFAKRTLDLLVATPVVLLILPVTTLVVWALHRMQSPGPVFYEQTRRGVMGRLFQIIKYRTMHPNNEESKQACKDDPRAFPAGKILRRFSIDELPQFINVLKGDMSIVGPRPHMEQHEELWARAMSRYSVRRFILPGITGWAQVQGFRGEVRSEADIEKRVEADIHYLENWSLSLDCAIILRTFAQFLFPTEKAL